MSTLEQSRHLATTIPGPRSQSLIDRKAAAVSRGVGNTMPVYAARAFGGIVEDVDGNRLIDLGSGIAVTTIGASAPRVVKAVTRQVADFTHTCFMITPYEGYVAVAEALNRLTPGTHEKRSALFNSGSEAVENAIKIARSYTRKPAVVAFDHAYHGRTNLTMALTAKSMPTSTASARSHRRSTAHHCPIHSATPNSARTWPPTVRWPPDARSP